MYAFVDLIVLVIFFGVEKRMDLDWGAWEMEEAVPYDKP